MSSHAAFTSVMRASISSAGAESCVTVGYLGVFAEVGSAQKGLLPSGPVAATAATGHHGEPAPPAKIDEGDHQKYHGRLVVGLLIRR